MSSASLKRRPSTRPTCGEVARRANFPQFGDPKWIARRDAEIEAFEHAKDCGGCRICADDRPGEKNAEA